VGVGVATNVGVAVGDGVVSGWVQASSSTVKLTINVQSDTFRMVRILSNQTLWYQDSVFRNMPTSD